VARVLTGIRVDRIAEALTRIDADLMPAVLAQLSAVQVAEMISYVPMSLALWVVQQLPRQAVADVLLVLPSQWRVPLQEALEASPTATATPTEGPTNKYFEAAGAAVRRMSSNVSWLDPRVGTLVTELFGRPVQVTLRDRPDGIFAADDMRAAAGGVDWRRMSALLVLTNASLDPSLGAASRDLAQRGYIVEIVVWGDDRDDGVLKRALVRFLR
jgi:hypothetical protein